MDMKISILQKYEIIRSVSTVVAAPVSSFAALSGSLNKAPALPGDIYYRSLRLHYGSASVISSFVRSRVHRIR